TSASPAAHRIGALCIPLSLGDNGAPPHPIYPINKSDWIDVMQTTEALRKSHSMAKLLDRTETHREQSQQLGFFDSCPSGRVGGRCSVLEPCPQALAARQRGCQSVACGWCQTQGHAGN